MIRCVPQLMPYHKKEQAIAIAIEMRKNDETARKKRKQIKKIKYKAYCWGISIVAILYLVWLIWSVVEIRV